MPSQYQKDPSNKDPLLDHLDEINEELDEMEEQKRPEIPDKRSTIARYILLAVLGAVVGLSVRAAYMVFSNNTIDDYYDDEGVTLQLQPSVSDQEALRIYNLVYEDTYTVDSQVYGWNATMQDFQDNGWQLDPENSYPSTVSQNDTETVTLIRGEHELYSFGVYNDTESKIAIEKAPLDHIYCYDEELDFVTPLGFTLGMSESQMKSILDQNSIPYEITQYDTSVYYSCDVGGSDENGDYRAVMMDFDIREGKLDDVYIYVYNNGNSQVISLG